MQNPHGLPPLSTTNTTAAIVKKDEKPKPATVKVISEVKGKATVPCELHHFFHGRMQPEYYTREYFSLFQRCTRCIIDFNVCGSSDTKFTTTMGRGAQKEPAVTSILVDGSLGRTDVRRNVEPSQGQGERERRWETKSICPGCDQFGRFIEPRVVLRQGQCYLLLLTSLTFPHRHRKLVTTFSCLQEQGSMITAFFTDLFLASWYFFIRHLARLDTHVAVGANR